MTEELIIRHNAPNAKSRAEFHKKEMPFVLVFTDVPVMKTRKAKPITKRENSRNGILRITKK
jgi:hypothetical protein